MAKKSTTSEKLIDLSDLLTAIDTHDLEYYNRLTPEQKAEFSCWITMRSASSCNKHVEHYLIMVNDLVNSEFSSLVSHPNLQWKLLALCGIGSKQYHKWIAPPRKKGKNNVQEQLGKIFPNMKYDDLALLEILNSKEELNELFRDSGMSNKEIKLILK